MALPNFLLIVLSVSSQYSARGIDVDLGSCLPGGSCPDPTDFEDVGLALLQTQAQKIGGSQSTATDSKAAEQVSGVNAKMLKAKHQKMQEKLQKGFKGFSGKDAAHPHVQLHASKALKHGPSAGPCAGMEDAVMKAMTNDDASALPEKCRACIETPNNDGCGLDVTKVVGPCAGLDHDVAAAMQKNATAALPAACGECLAKADNNGCGLEHPEMAQKEKQKDSGWADYAEQATNAIAAESAVNAEAAMHAINADESKYADSAKQAEWAELADEAMYALNAEKAEFDCATLAPGLSPKHVTEACGKLGAMREFGLQEDPLSGDGGDGGRVAEMCQGSESAKFVIMTKTARCAKSSVNAKGAENAVNALMAQTATFAEKSEYAVTAMKADKAMTAKMTKYALRVGPQAGGEEANTGA